MCGIAGIIKPDMSNKMILDSSIQKMINSLKHRGPDNAGIWIDSGIALGHQRLSILDLSTAGNQPMHSTNGQFIISFNGEIYNHLEIRKRLESESIERINWKGFSDTETLLKAFETYGISKTLTMCSGMFAIALWDTRKNILTLARDRFGEKPLYFGWVDKDFLFASEIKALKTYPNFNNSICKSALSDYLKFNYIPSPRCIYENIFKVKPGTFIQIDRSIKNFKQIKNNIFWSLENVVKKGQENLFTNEKEALSELEKTLQLSIKSQMISDVPLGAFLSGGIDSSLVVSLMQKESLKPIKTFTVGFLETQFDESKDARAISDHLLTDHNEIFVSEKETQEVISLLPHIYDEPFADSSQIPTYLICKLAKQKATVVLSGDGADELFGGYNRYIWCPRIWSIMSLLPYSLRKILSNYILKMSEKQLNIIFNIFTDEPAFKIHKIAKALENAKSLLSFMQNMTLEWKEGGHGLIKNYSHADYNNYSIDTESVEANLNLRDPISLMMYRDCKSYLQDDILCKLDRAAMSNSLETRVPFLDPRVVDLAWRFPIHHKIKKNIGKWPLRKILYKYVPAELLNKPKTGFSIPIGKWLRGALRDWAENLLEKNRLDTEGNFSSKVVRDIWNQHLSGKQDYSNRLWSILMFQAWFEKS